MALWYTAWLSIICLKLVVGAQNIVHDYGFEKRDNKPTIIPAPINVAPSQLWDGNDGSWSSFVIQAGSPRQSLRVMISTAFYNTWTILEAGCPNGTIVGCEASRGQPFLTNESLSWIPNSMWKLELGQNLGLDTAAYYGFDTLTLGSSESNLPTAKHMVMANYGGDTYWTGLFGLNPTPTNFSDFNDPQASFMSALFQNGSIPSLAYSYTAGNQYRLSGNQYGSLVLGGYDQSKFNLTENVTLPLGNDINRDLLIGVQSITMNTTATPLTSESGGFYALIDSTLPYYWLPVSVCKAFESALGITWDDEKELYLVNETLHKTLLEVNPEVKFTLGESSSGGGTVDIVIPYAAFDVNISFPVVWDSTYYFPLKRATDSTQYTLGRAFLQEAYLIVDYERRNFTLAPCAWEENAESEIRSIISPSFKTRVSGAKSGVDKSTIVGITVGTILGVVAVILVLLVALWLLRRKRQRQRDQKLAKLNDKVAFVGTNHSDSSVKDICKPITPNAMGGELSNDNEIHEMQSTNPAYKTKMVHEVQDTIPSSLLGVHHDQVYQDGRSVTWEYNGTWQSEGSTVQHDTQYMSELAGSDVHELPDSRRQSWADGIDTLGRLQPSPSADLPNGFPADEKKGLH